MKKQKANWADSQAAHNLYLKRRAEAQAKANELGFDHGLEINHVFKDYMVFMLPQKQNRSGHELRCEVVRCENLDKCQKGHGPLA